MVSKKHMRAAKAAHCEDDPAEQLESVVWASSVRMPQQEVETHAERTARVSKVRLGGALRCSYLKAALYRSGGRCLSRAALEAVAGTLITFGPGPVCR